MVGVSAQKAPVGAGRLWQIALLAVAGAFGTASRADAALYYWSDSEPGFSRPGPTVPPRRQIRRRQEKKVEAPERESAKPQGPLIIAISIDHQSLKIYDDKGFFAETPISTGMRGHPTPMGVFSIIQKHKLHHSNIYSGAPMPYMQRITWSGIAMHAGVLPGYPASHGCIRMPMAFATKMWNWTRMGARVVVTPGEMVPASFSHPLLAAQKVVPQPAAASDPQADAPSAAKANKVADADVTPKPADSEVGLGLRSTVGHADGVKALIDESSSSAPLRDQTHTADAGDIPATKAVTMTDAAPSRARDAVSARDDDTPTAEEKPNQKSEEVAKSDPAKSATEPADAKQDNSKQDGIVSADDKPAQSQSSEAKTTDDRTTDDKSANDKSAEAKPVEIDKAADKPDQTAVNGKPASEAATSETSANAKAEEKAGEAKLEAKADDVKIEAPKPDVAKAASEKPDAAIKAIAGTGSSISDAKKDEIRVPDIDKPAASKPISAATAASKRTGQIAVFISRKDSKLYVRQNFAPLFEAPVTIAPSERPLGTHVFTAEVDKNDANVLHWSVVSLPVPSRHVERRDEDERASRRRKMTGAVETRAMPAPDSPAEALDRLTIPADVMARIVDALSTGSSIIVSDQGISAGETGEGTDFIVSLR
jgi:lipoprotein-anchoring transpeptidase ErfK/SrfK